MISKLIVHGRDRAEAMSLMRDSLDSYVIHGMNHNIPFLRTILDHPRFISGDITTKFIEEEYPDGFAMDCIPITDKDYDFMITTAAAVYRHLRRDVKADDTLCVELEGKLHSVKMSGGTMELDGREFTISTDYELGQYVFESTVNGERAICQVFGRWIFLELFSE